MYFCEHGLVLWVQAMLLFTHHRLLGAPFAGTMIKLYRANVFLNSPCSPLDKTVLSLTRGGKGAHESVRF